MELAPVNLSEGNGSDPEPPAEPRPLFGIGVENFITLVVFGLIFAMGVLGNSLVITVLARSKPGKPRSTTNLFILNLSIADLAYLLFCIPFQATVYALPTWVLGAFICKFIHYFFTVSMLVSIFTLAAMSVDRYVAIVHSRRSSSLRVSRNALLGVGFIWALSIAMASPVAYYQRLFHRDSNQTFCWEHWPNQLHKKAYVVCTFVFGYLLPLLLICFCYAKVLNHLHKKLKNMSKKSEASKKKTAQTVLVVVVVFGISWLPHHVIHLWAEFGAFPLTPASFFFRITAHCLAYSNSSVNPIIYAFLSENFRKAYKQVFKCRVCNESPHGDAKEKNRIDTPPSTNCTHV
ncbi:galanin receptor 1 [Rattus norvegicus]|uniref:Galanin receptor type 1 n=2 Tax=Rattus norvegicus TaxID=10116 RepID=GALR1_RAT|nr:galanin receptor type 1 [Rattus norvegicus]Q62805.1 RecName: Full=Galanin receptor type 1; Short=GAL1-R; Short=GALR-1 [Rattus norvegicus]AAC52438.1 galanin receptor GALR1 [Rattus norvegicus]EDL75210.1 galanin receptor 1 [Rattus norvegicus]prf//2209407A galanin receptor:ISOTYPE=GALR1 [Rattus norvegicus]|eukprot:NP_037090.2 galanin receptor type 1 [Rattus norvegicus]